MNPKMELLWSLRVEPLRKEPLLAIGLHSRIPNSKCNGTPGSSPENSPYGRTCRTRRGSSFGPALRVVTKLAGHTLRHSGHKGRTL